MQSVIPNRRRAFTTTAMTSLFFILALTARLATMAYGFSLTPITSSRSSRQVKTMPLAATAKNFPPMSRDEVQAMLDTIPVYAVTDTTQEGLVLLKEKNNPNDIAYFFFSPDAANTVFSPLRKKQNESTVQQGEWSVSAYPLGLVWFDLINDPEEQNKGIEYRLLPEPDDLIGAQNLLREQQKQSGAKPNPKLNELFRSPYNEIPIFVDQFLRVTAPQGGDDGEKVPLYFGLKNLMETCNQAIKASSGEYQAAMSAIDMRDLIDEMTKEEGNPNDYRKAILVPPMPKAEDNSSDATTSSPEATKPDDFNWEGKSNSYGKGLGDNEGISTPTATNDWSD